MARWRIFIEEEVTKRKIYWLFEDEETPAGVEQEHEIPSKQGFIKKYIWNPSFAIGMSVIGSIIAGIIIGGLF